MLLLFKQHLKVSIKERIIYADGDIREQTLHQVFTTIGDRSIAAQSAQRYLEEPKEKLKLKYN